MSYSIPHFLNLIPGNLIPITIKIPPIPKVIRQVLSSKDKLNPYNITGVLRFAKH